MKTSSWRLAWQMLSPRERRQAPLVLLVSLIGAGAQVAMIGAVMPFLSFIADPTSVDQTGLIAAIYERLGFESRYSFAFALGLGSIGVIVISNLVLMVRGYMIARFTVMRVHALSTRLLKSYLRKPYEYFLGRNSSDIGKRILSETNEISVSFLQPAAELIASSISAIFILTFLLYLEPLGTLVGAGIVLTFYLTVHRFSGRYIKRLGQARTASNARRFRMINEIFGGIKDLKIHQKEEVYTCSFEASSSEMMKANWKSRIATDTPQYLVQAFFLSGVIMACLLMIDVDLFNAEGNAGGQLIPMLGVFAFAGQRLVPELQKIYAASSKMSFGAAALRNVHEDMDMNPPAPRPMAHPIPFQDSLELRGLSYHYPEASAGISDLSTTITKGARIGIVGGTGAGKTTLVDLILGLLEPKSGNLVVDGKPLDNGDALDGWRQRVAYVPQSIFLTDASIAENIAFGLPFASIDMDKVVACAKIAQIHDFIMTKTPAGYASMTGERGTMLSGGQRQRIGIARALYRDADLIVLDEATSALDTTTEREVMAAIDALPRSLTLVMIAHRLDTLCGCDKLLVMSDGRIVEEGSWDALVQRGGLFSTMCAAGQPAAA